MPRYDVAVIGAGPAGICAALSAARSGARTLLVTDRPVPGGNSSSEIRVWTRGATGGGNLFAEEMGIWGELKLRALARDALGSVLTWDDVLLDALLGQEGLTLLLNTQMTAATVENGRIERVTLRGLRTESEREAQAQVFVDCTGDGYLSKLAGVPFRTGREGREEFGESLALSAPDGFTQGCSILLQSRRLDHPAPYIAPDYAYPLERIRQLVDRGGRVVRADMQGSDCWWFEYGGKLDVIAEDQRIGLELRAIALGIWNYIKNSGRYDAENLQLEWLGLYPGRRGSRRLVGEETLTQRDVTGGLGRPGAVAYGGWYMDSHPSGGVLSEKDQCRQLSVSCYGLPLGCLYNPCVENLLFAGRCASMSYAAYTSARVMNTCALMGQAAGTAAAMCAARGMTPENLKNTALEALLRRLALDDALLWARVEDGFLRSDHISATSVLRPEARPCAGRWPLKEETFVVYPACGGEARLAVESEGEMDVRFTLHPSPLPSRRAPLAQDVPVRCAHLPAGRSELVLPAEGEGFLQARLEPAQGVTLVGGTPLPGVLAGSCAEAEWFHPCLALSRDDLYAPRNVQDGYLRPWGGPRAWASEGLGPAGEALCLRWRKPVELDSVLLLFDPELSMELTSSRCETWDPHHHYAARPGMPAQLARDYRLTVRGPGGERTVAEVRGNVQRRRLHRFSPVTCTELEVRVTATYGGGAVVYAVLPNPEYDR